MKKVKTLAARFKSATPKYVKFMQTLSGAIAGSMLAYDHFPEPFKMLKPEAASIIAYIALGLIFILQFTEKKGGTNATN